MITLVVCPRKTISQRPATSPLPPPPLSSVNGETATVKKSAKSLRGHGSANAGNERNGTAWSSVVAVRRSRSLSPVLCLFLSPSLSGIRIRFYFLSNKFRRPIVAWRPLPLPPRSFPPSPSCRRSSRAALGLSFICKCNRTVHSAVDIATDTGDGQPQPQPQQQSRRQSGCGGGGSN